MEKFSKNKNGITLIALVVTIIVLLILAAVSLNLVAGESGILSRAENASDETIKATAKEEVQLQLADLLAGYYEDKYLNKNTSVQGKSVGKYISEKVNEETDDEEDKEKLGKTTSGYQYTVSEEADGNGDYDVTISDKDGKELATGKLTKDGKLELTDTINNSNNKGEKTQEYKSKHPEEHIPTGFSYKEGSVDEGYVISDTEGNEFVWIPVKSEQTYSKKLGTNNNYVSLGSKGDDSADSLNNDINNAVAGDVLNVNNILGQKVIGTLADKPEAKIVNSAGGFWVGRYETGTTQTVYPEKDSDTLDTIKVKADLQPVRKITQDKSLQLANTWKSGEKGEGTVAFQSGLITGTQWDMVCKFIGWDITNSDSTSWGNYKKVASASFTGYTGQSTWSYGTVTKSNSQNLVFPTGKFIHSGNIKPDTVKKNIYDIAGNVWEWTTEQPKSKETNRILRGGGTDEDFDSNSSFPTYRVGLHPATASATTHIGFRMVLYVE